MRIVHEFNIGLKNVCQNDVIECADCVEGNHLQNFHIMEDYIIVFKHASKMAVL